MVQVLVRAGANENGDTASSATWAERELLTATKRMMVTARAAAKTAVYLLKVFPMLPSRPLDWVTPQPVVEKQCYQTSHGEVEGELYRPSSPGPHPGVVVCMEAARLKPQHP